MFYEMRALILLTLLSGIKCSVVIDAVGQKGLVVSNYCPKMTYCPEGAHVMCMYHDPKHKFGPRCNKPRKVETTPALAKLFLFKANKLRAEVAQGIARGKSQAYLPRGYGIFRLKWDEELATFAQLLANQCVLKHDLCRSTSRFPDPGQTVGMCRLSHPEWMIVKPRKFQFATPGLSTEKLIYAINQSALGWAGQKEYVTPNMIRDYPDWGVNPRERGGKLYMDIISGDARYMGCGISAFNEFANRDGQPSLFNSILVICNFSARGKKGNPLFKTVRPTTPDFSPACGCPIEDSFEDDECLCVEKKFGPLTTSQETLKHPVTCSDSDMNCEPTVVLLPIFTVEDAPPQKLIARERPILSGPQKSVEIIDVYDNAEDNNNLYGNLEYHQQTMKPMVIDPHRYAFTVRPVPSTNKKNYEVKNRHFNKPALPKNRLLHKQSLRTPPRNTQTNRKSRSIFSRVQKFQLPRNGMSAMNDIKKDVIARKDFSSVQKLVDDYLNSRRINDPIKIETAPNPHDVDFDEILMRKDTHDVQEHTETFLNTAEERVINYNQYLKLRNLTTEEPRTEFKNVNEDSDNKLMALLNTLEQEVKHIQLHGDEKEIFDAKIRKIYGSVVGKPVDLLTHKHKEPDSDFLEHDMTNYIKHKPNNYLPIGEVLDRKVDQHFEADRIKDFDNDKRIIDENDHELLKSYDKPMHSKYDRPTNIARSPRYRDINSDEEFRPRHYDRYTYDGIKSRNTYSDSRGLYRHRDLDEMKVRGNRGDERMKNKNFYVNDMNDDPLMSVERRRYYQEKLDNLEKRLHNTRSYKRLQRTEPDADHHLRAIRPSRDEVHARSKNQIDSYYMPERARYMHGF